MQKPLLLRREELCQQLIDAINAANLPPVVLSPILEDLVRQTKQQLAKQYADEAAEYKAALANEKGEDEDGG